MDYWRNPEVQAAETELQNLMNEAPEVAVANPGRSNPVSASTSPEIQYQYPVQRSNIFPVAGLGNIPTSGVWTEDVEMTALRKPYPGAPTPVSQSVPVCQGFNVPKSAAQDSQAQIPQFFNFIGSSDAGAQAVKKTSVNVSVPPSEPVTEKSPEEIQRGVSELLQWLDNEQKAIMVSSVHMYQ